MQVNAFCLKPGVARRVVVVVGCGLTGVAIPVALHVVLSILLGRAWLATEAK